MSHTPEMPRVHAVSCPVPVTGAHGRMAPFDAGRHRPRGHARLRALVSALVAAPIVLATLALVTPAPSRARDTTGLSERLTQEQRDWVRELRSGHGVPCCDEADGIDPAWDIKDGAYRVKYAGQWLVVPPHALLTQPNRIGVARAWIGRGDGEVFVTCFLPGPTT